MSSYQWPQLKPMLATHSEVFDDPDYLFEIKWDGFRCLAYLENKETRLFSRNGFLLNKRFPQLTRLHQSSPAVLLDGEIVALVDGRPDFSALQASFEKHQPLPKGCILTYVVFDVLYYEQECLLAEPLIKRKTKLSENLENQSNLLISQYLEGEGSQLFAAAKAQLLEGIMAKHKDSRYLPGQRSELWKKIKWRQTADFLICGFLHRHNQLVSLAVANRASDTEPLIYRGQVGSGFKVSHRHSMLPLLQQLVTANNQVLNFPNQPNLVQIQPIISCKVEFLEFTSYGLIRQPVLLEFLLPNQ